MPYSQRFQKLPNCGRVAPRGFTHGMIPRQTQPPACSESATVGSWRQSHQTKHKPPSTVTRRHSDSHSEHQYPNERWSRLSPANSPTRTHPFAYLMALLSSRSERMSPPDEYGGSVTTASTLPLGTSSSSRSVSPLQVPSLCLTSSLGLPILAARRVEAVRVSGAELRDVAVRDLVERQADVVGHGIENPQNLAELVSLDLQKV